MKGIAWRFLSFTVSISFTASLVLGWESLGSAGQAVTITVSDVEELPPVVTPEPLPPPEPAQLDCPATPDVTTAPIVDPHFGSLISDLSSQRVSLQQEKETLMRIGSEGAESSGHSPGVIDVIDRDLTRAERRQKDLFGRLRKQMTTLESILRSHRVKPLDAPPRSPPPPPATDAPPRVDPSLEDVVERPLPVEAAATSEESQPSETTVVPISVTNQPVDRLALANNLYGAGQWQLALRIYQKLDLSDRSPSEQTWIQAQMAACHHRLGDVGEAEKIYRMVAGRGETDFMGEHARWWLDTIQQRKELQKRAQSFDSTLETFREASP